MSTESLIEAINCIHSPKSSTSERNAAYNTCEQFKSSCNNLPQVGLQLSRPTSSVIERHFGYQLLDHFVKFGWGDLSPDVRAQFKGMLIDQVLERGTLPLGGESSLLRNTLSSLLTEVLKREWPEQWESFLGAVARNVQQNTTAGEVMLTALARLVEDIELDSKLVACRRSELLRAIGSNRGKLLEIITGRLQEAIEKPEGGDAAIMTCMASLNLLGAASSMTWFQVSVLYERKSHVCTLLFLLLQNARLRQHAADTLHNIAARKTPTSDSSEFVRFCLQDDALKMIFTLCSGICDSDMSDDSALFLKTLCRMYVNLGENHVSNVLRNELTLPQEQLQKYFQLMLIFYENHLITVRSIVVDVWVHFLNFEPLATNPDLRAAVPHVVQATCKHFCKPLEPVSDVCDMFELTKLYNTLLSKMISLIHFSAKLAPNEALAVVFNWQSALLASPVPTETLASEDTKPFNVWKYFSIFTEKMITASLKSKEKIKVEPILESLSALLKFDCSDPLISYWYVSTVNGYVPVFKLSDSLTIPMLEKLFYLLGRKFDHSYPAGITREKMTALVSDLHRHTSSCLLRFVTNYPDVISWEVFQAMQSLYENLLKSIDNQRYGSMLLILEALISGSNKIPDVEQQEGYIRQLIAPLIGFLETPNLPQQCASFTSFLHLLQITPEACTGDVTTPIKQIKLALATLCAVSKRFTKDGSPRPAFRMVYPYMETVFVMCKQINQFWNTDTYKDYPWLKGPMEPDKDTKMLYCTLLEKRTATGLSLRMHLVGLTDYANQLVEVTCEHLSRDVYSWGAFPDYIMSSFVQFLPTMQKPRVKAVLHSVVRPFLTYCPPESIALCLPVLQLTLEAVYSRLSSEWDSIQVRKLVITSDDYSESSAELDEIFNDHMVLIVTREYCELLNTFFVCKKKEERRKSGGNGNFNPVTAALLMDNRVGPSLLLSVFSCMAWGDGVSSNRACTMAHNAIKMISSGQPLSEAATRTFLVKTLQALQIHGQHDNCLYTLLNVAVAIVQTTYRSIPHVTRDVLLALPSVIPDKIDRFFTTLERREASGRNLRDSLQSLVSPIVGRPLSEAGKQNYRIHEAKPLLFKTVVRNENTPPNKESALDGLQSLFHPTKL